MNKGNRDNKDNKKNKKNDKKVIISKIVSLIIVLILAAAAARYTGPEEAENTTPVETVPVVEQETQFTFRSQTLLDEHYQKHGTEMGFSSAKAYQDAASAVVNNEDALHKLEAEDGDDVYYLEHTNELVIVSTDGYIRTYFQPEHGISYFNRQ